MKPLIQEFFRKNQAQLFSIEEIKTALSLKKDYSSVFRVVKQLVEEGYLEKKGRGRVTRYCLKSREIEQYFELPFFEREKKAYNRSFLADYQPNQSAFLNHEDLAILNKCNENTLLSTDFIVNNKRLFETLLIDLAYSSSFLEGNTYSYLDTEVLIKYGEEAQGKSKEETVMILNHKNILEYLLRHKNEIDLAEAEIKNVHSLLGKGLLRDKYLGVVRASAVRIGGSTYTPLEDKYLLEDEFKIFLEKLNAIKNPFEQSFFILVFLPYFQLFQDINKRTSRVFANVPLLKNNLIPFSFLTVNKRDYVLGILSVYELNRVEKLKEVFLTGYERAYERYF